MRTRAMRARPPAVAGIFYPASAGVLKQQVRELLQSVGPPVQDRRPRGLIVPHAGYPYSGRVAARAYQAIAPYHDQFNRVVLIGPAHRVPLSGAAVPSAEAFRTPLGDVPLDRQALVRLAGLPGVRVADAAHIQEHSLEVQLPFLCEVLDAFSLVPIVVGDCDASFVAELLEPFVDDPGTLLVVSSDLSHFHPYEAAQALDRRTSDAITAKSTSLEPEQACGARAINGLTLLASRRGFDVVEVDLRNSGDTAGDRSRVVGYGADVVC